MWLLLHQTRPLVVAVCVSSIRTMGTGWHSVGSICLQGLGAGVYSAGLPAATVRTRANLNDEDVQRIIRVIFGKRCENFDL